MEASKHQHHSYLVLGGARSGKSGYAERLAKASKKDVIYIATATAQDGEMQQRIAKHKQDRPASWKTIEEPLALADTLQQWSSTERIILVDCLTLWLTNLLAQPDSRMQKELEQLYSCLADLPGTTIFVSNEVGMGIVPMGELTRRFVDESGRLHQRLAQLSDTVILMVAGLPHTIK